MGEFDPRVAHVLRRATLGPTYDEVRQASRLGLDAMLSRMVSEVDRPLTAQEEAAAAIGDVFLKDGKSLRAGWMLRMLNSPNLFREKLTLFWHNHFATAISKVNDTRAMAAQIKMLRSIGVGPFRPILAAMARDPAMLIWLDNALNVKGKPNENFGRELMELFTLGIGNYTETDVQEVARAFTGWGLDRRKAFHFATEQHDDQPKTVLGRQGIKDGDEVLDILATHDRTAFHVSWKIWRFFVGPDPTPADLEPMTTAWKNSGGKIGDVLRAMFTSPAFFDPRYVARQIKNPIEFVVGLVRALEAPLDVQDYADAAAAMGMELYNPPDVNGWPGGEEWISSFTLLERIRLVRQLVARGQGGIVGGLDTRKIISGNFIGNNDELADHFLLRFLHRIPEGNLRAELLKYLAAGTRAASVLRLADGQRDEKIRGMIRLILCSPEYQVC